MGLYDTCSYQSPQGRQVFGVCCNNTLPEELPEEPESEVTEDDEDEYPIAASEVRSKCGFRSVLPQVTLYTGQSPVFNPLLAFTPYIVNGYEARPHEFPWMAALLNNNRQFCGGSLIDDNHILTAAHCVAQ